MSMAFSLRRRLLLGFLPVLILIAGVITSLAHKLAEDVFYDNIDRILRAHSRGLFLVLENSSDPIERQQLFTEVLADVSTFRPALFHIIPSDSNSPSLTNADPNSLKPCAFQPDQTLGCTCSATYLGQEYRQVASQEFGRSQSYKITLAIPIESWHNDLHHLLQIMFILGGLGVLLAIGLSIASVYWALAPINQAGRILLQLPSEPTPSFTPRPNLGLPVELAPFQQAMDQMLARINRYVERHRQFSRNAAHELRTPITLAKTTLQGALYESHSEEQYRKIIGEALSGLDRMNDLIEQLQLLCFLEDTPHHNHVETVELNSLLRECIAAHCPRAQFEDRSSASPVLIQGNPTLLYSLWANLLDNARQYGPIDHPVQVILSTTASEVCVQIKDRGYIPPEELLHLTDRFYRVEQSRNRKHGGAGLGLTIVQEIIKHHGGQLNITSSPDQGTCVDVCLKMIHT